MKKIFLFSLIAFFTLSLTAQSEKKDTIIFTIVKENKITPIKNQANSGTCWSFSGLAFFESEILRMGKPETDLSEMFVVRHSYEDKADKYVRTDANINFAAGGSFHDVWYVLKNYGAVPEIEMSGLNYGSETHNHGELDALGKNFVETIARKPNKTLSPAWKNAFSGIMEAYLGKYPEKFTVAGKEYTPISYVKSLGLNMDDYVSVTSYTHQPFYCKFALEISDNWRWGESYNVPLNEMMSVFDNAINNGYTIAWGADVSESGFTRDGLAMLPETNKELLQGTDQARWVGTIAGGKFTVKAPMIEQNVTQESRQKGYDNKETTDDHGMQIFGIAKDQTGKEYYMIKNSWGSNNKYSGVWYVSKAFAAAKTMNILVHKDAIPKDVRKKLGI